MKNKVLFIVLLPLLFWQCAKSPYQKLALSESQKNILAGALAEKNQHYDAVEKMLSSDFSSPGYHTTLTGGPVHRTRASLTYAASCLDSDDAQLKQRGFDIIDRVIDLQDQDPDSKTYGIWPWFLEEPLEQMSPPDWNWADFCGVQLLQAVIYHKDEFDPALLEKVNKAVYRAARSIEKRNVGPAYTNIAIMGTYVTMMTAELQDLPEMKEYAMRRLQRFYDYTMANGAFTEYNSPTYTVVALKELARMKAHVPDRHAQKLVMPLYDLAWQEIAVHFHAPTAQWAGPHSRCYHTLLPKKTLALIQSATSDHVSFAGVDGRQDMEAHRLNLACPKKLEHYFLSIEKPRQIDRTFVAGENPLIGTTYLAQEFCLGSINHGDFWEQRRPLIAYWGDAAAPSYLRIRFMHDGHDFAGAQFYSVQEKGLALCGVVLSTDGGDTHVNLDKIKDGVITAHDLRLRFEFGGRAAEKRINLPRSLHDNALLTFDGVDVRISVPFAAFEKFSPYWDGEKIDGKACYDVVLYSGDEKRFDLNKINRAAAAVLVATGFRGDMAGALRGEENDAAYTIGYGPMELTFPTRPATRKDLLQEVTGKGAPDSTAK